MKKIQNNFVITGFVGMDAQIREFDNASIARFSVAVSRGEKDKDGKTQYTSAFISIEAWRKNEHKSSFDTLKKGQMITCEGYLKPEAWTAEDGTTRSKVVMVATKFYLTPDAEKSAEAPKKS
ncbi:MAG: single-stranded DNA-binding protein [Phocaeicola sp.]